MEVGMLTTPPPLPSPRSIYDPDFLCEERWRRGIQRHTLGRQAMSILYVLSNCNLTLSCHLHQGRVFLDCEHDTEAVAQHLGFQAVRSLESNGRWSEIAAWPGLLTVRFKHLSGNIGSHRGPLLEDLIDYLCIFDSQISLLLTPRVYKVVSAGV